MTLMLATDVLRFPPLDGKAPVSESASEIPRALAFRATASPLNMVAFCAKVATGLKTKMAVRQVARIESFLVFIGTFSYVLFRFQAADAGAAAHSNNRPSVC